MGPAALGSQNWKMHPEPRQQSWHSRGEKSFLPGACPCKKQIGFYSGPCEGRKSATLGSSLPKAFPLGEASGSCNPTQKKRPKSGHVHGHRNSPSTGTLRPTTPKPASGNERAIKPGVQGARPRPSFSPFLGRNGDPRRAGGAPGALRPKVASELLTRRVPPPQPPAEEPTWMVSPSIPHPRGKHNSPTGAAPVFRPTPPWLGGPPGTAAGQTPCPPGRWAGPPPPPGGGRSP